jgi:Secretion system C-terminal sorting domain
LNGICATCTTDSNGTSALTTGIAMSGTNGKVILVNVTTQQTGVNPTGAQIVDKVGYGTTPTGFEGTGPTGTALTSSTSVSRNSGGCADTNSNAGDFTTGNVAPRNSATPVNVCPPLSIQQNDISGLKVYPNPAKDVLYISSDNNTTKQVEVYDVLGKVVLNTKTTNAPINIASLNRGVYVVKVTEEGKTASRKLVIE